VNIAVPRGTQLMVETLIPTGKMRLSRNNHSGPLRVMYVLCTYSLRRVILGCGVGLDVATVPPVRLRSLFCSPPPPPKIMDTAVENPRLFFRCHQPVPSCRRTRSGFLSSDAPDSAVRTGGQQGPMLGARLAAFSTSILDRRASRSEPAHCSARMTTSSPPTADHGPCADDWA